MDLRQTFLILPFYASSADKPQGFKVEECAVTIVAVSTNLRNVIPAKWSMTILFHQFLRGTVRLSHTMLTVCWKGYNLSAWHITVFLLYCVFLPQPPVWDSNIWLTEESLLS